MVHPQTDTAPRHQRMFELLRQSEQAALTCTRLQTRGDAADLSFRALALASLNRKVPARRAAGGRVKQAVPPLALIKRQSAF